MKIKHRDGTPVGEHISQAGVETKEMAFFAEFLGYHANLFFNVSNQGISFLSQTTTTIRKSITFDL